MKKRILIVEDEPSIVTLLKYNLEKAGYLTEVVMDGEEAVRIIQSKTFSLVLLDVMLPGLNGYDVSRNVRKQKIEVPIMILTAKNDEKDRIRGLESGADDYLVKPFSPRELLVRIKAILRRTEDRGGETGRTATEVEESR